MLSFLLGLLLFRCPICILRGVTVVKLDAMLHALVCLFLQLAGWLHQIHYSIFTTLWPFLELLDLVSLVLDQVVLLDELHHQLRILLEMLVPLHLAVHCLHLCLVQPVVSADHEALDGVLVVINDAS